MKFLSLIDIVRSVFTQSTLAKLEVICNVVYESIGSWDGGRFSLQIDCPAKRNLFRLLIYWIAKIRIFSDIRQRIFE